MTERVVTVRLRWGGASGNALYAGGWQVGFVIKVLGGNWWHAVLTNRAGITFCFATDAEARAAVERAAIEALGGENVKA
jgi:hypothetical protein